MEQDFSNELSKLRSGSLMDKLKNEREFRSLLFEQFKLSHKIRDFEKHLIKQQIDEELINERQIKEEYKKFYSLKENDVPEDCLTNNIEATSIFKTLNEIEDVFNAFKETFIAPEQRAETIIDLIETLSHSIRETVANTIINDDWNIHLDINEANDEQRTEWLLARGVFNNYMNRYKDKQADKQTDEIYLDYSSNLGTEKIVFLHELGVLEYLQNKMIEELHGFSANKLAEILSTFTGIEQTTAQSYLSPMFNKDNVQRNNPLSENSLVKVRNKLKNIGFNTSKTT